MMASSINEILADDSFRRRAEQLSDVVKRTDGLATTATVINEFL
jgi:UDP:flavonoid glycosyltransferase YjiC (YdhE family)